MSVNHVRGLNEKSVRASREGGVGQGVGGSAFVDHAEDEMNCNEVRWAGVGAM